MKFLARIAGDIYGTREVELVPNSMRYAIRAYPHPPIGGLVTIAMPGLAHPSPAGVQAWLAQEAGQRTTDELRPHLYRRAELADFMDAVNAEHFLDATAHWNADSIVAFARAQGSELLAEIRAELDGAARAARLGARAERFAQITGIDDAPAILAELAKLHDIEHLMGLEHAVVRWIGSASAVRSIGLRALARTLPDEDASAGISDEWFGWWWRLARSCTRAALTTAVEQVLAHVDRECTGTRRMPVAPEARASAREMADRMRHARHATLWATPFDERVVVKTVVRDLADAHYVAFMAVSHAAHALAYQLGARLSPSQAHRGAMKTLAQVALDAVITSDA